jgi:hypothetical protein
VWTFSAGHQSRCEDVVTGDVCFIENKQGGRVWLPRSVAVGIDLALRCVQQFVVDLERPSAINWVEL